MNEIWIPARLKWEEVRLSVDGLRALYRAVTDRHAFTAITNGSVEKQVEDLQAAEEYKRKTKIAYYEAELKRCREALRTVRGEDYIRLRKRMSYIRGKIREKEYQQRYRKTPKFRKWKAEYMRRYRARRAGADCANTRTDTDGSSSAKAAEDKHGQTRTDADGQRPARGRPRKER